LVPPVPECRQMLAQGAPERYAQMTRTQRRQ
jgi:hypothetical protein